MYKNVFKAVSQIMGVPVETLNEKSSQYTVGYWDSLKQMNLILSIEEEFSVSLSDEEIMKISSIKDIIKLLKEKGVPDEKL